MKKQTEANDYTPEVINCLKQAGWFEGRIVDISKHEKMWMLNNFPSFDKAQEFMREFGGLVIRFYDRTREREDNIIIDVEEGLIYGVMPERITEVYTERIGKQLTVIGAAYHYTMNLIMDEDGYVYAEFDNYIAKIGDAPYNFFNTALDPPQEFDALN